MEVTELLRKACLVLVLGLLALYAFAQQELKAPTAGSPTPERTLAGITVGKSWDHVVKLYGQPNEIVVGLQASASAPMMGAGMPGMMQGAGMPGMMGPGMMGPGMMGPGMMGPGMMGSGMPGMMGPGMMGSGMPGMTQGARPGAGMPGMMPGAGMPGMMGSGMPGMMGPGMMGPGMGPMPGMRPAGTATPMGGPVGPQGGVFPLPGIPGAGAGMPGATPSPQITVSPDKMLWIYRLKGGITLRVTLAQADGRVVEVSVSGNKWEKARTSKGITLGSSYTDVLNAYGWTEETSTSGDYMFCRYDSTYHVVFGIRQSDKKVVSITISM